MNHEISLIACCLLNNTLIDEALARGLQDDYFNGTAEQQVWKAMTIEYKRGKSIDTLWADNIHKRIIGEDTMPYTHAKAEILALRHEFLSALESIVQEYARRRLSRLLEDTLKRSKLDDPQQLIDEMLAELPQLKDKSRQESDEQVVERIIERLDRGIEYPTQFPQLDYLVKGVEPGVLWVIGGYTSNGKSTFTLNIANNLAHASQPVTYFSTEMSKEQLMTRIATMESGVNISTAHTLTDEEKGAFKEGLRKTQMIPITIYQTLSLPEITMHIRSRESKLYVVDYVQMVDPGLRIETEVKRLGYVVRELETCAKENDVCVIATSQFRRGVEGEVAPTLSSFRGSGEIEENADIGVLMYYPYQQATHEGQRAIEKRHARYVINVEVRKNRIHGLLGMTKLELDPKSMRMKEVKSRKPTKQKERR